VLGQGVAEGGGESGGLGPAGEVVPDGAEDSEVVGVGEFGSQGFGGGQDGAVSLQDVGQDGDLVAAWLGVAGVGLGFRSGRGAEAGVFPGEPAGSGEFW
jgi:hypothetical protein